LGWKGLKAKKRQNGENGKSYRRQLKAITMTDISAERGQMVSTERPSDAQAGSSKDVRHQPLEPITSTSTTGHRAAQKPPQTQVISDVIELLLIYTKGRIERAEESKPRSTSSNTNIPGKASISNPLNKLLIHKEAASSSAQAMLSTARTSTPSLELNGPWGLPYQSQLPAASYTPLGEKSNVNLMTPRGERYPWTIGTGYLRYINGAERQFGTAKENSKYVTVDGHRERDPNLHCLVWAVMVKDATLMLKHIAVMFQAHQWPKYDICNFRTREDHPY
jgi:hypothetical protein